jgi:hypothetical protein
VHAGQPKVEYATPLEDDEDRLDASYDDEPLRYRTVANILGEQSPPDQLHLTYADEPTTYAEVQGDPVWWVVME